MIDPKVALQRVATLCSKQEQSTGDILEKLRSWNIPDADAEQIIKTLHKEKFLDDNRYARFYVKDKFKFNRWGKIKISYMLRRKGIPGNIIQEALEVIEEEPYFQTCMDLIKNKSLSVRDKNIFARKSKLFRFAAGRGFEPEIIHRVLNMIQQD